MPPAIEGEIRPGDPKKQAVSNAHEALPEQEGLDKLSESAASDIKRLSKPIPLDQETGLPLKREPEKTFWQDEEGRMMRRVYYGEPDFWEHAPPKIQSLPFVEGASGAWKLFYDIEIEETKDGDTLGEGGWDEESILQQSKPDK